MMFFTVSLCHGWLVLGCLLLSITSSSGGVMEEKAMQTFREAYNLTLCPALKTAAGQDYGNKLVNRCLLKLDKKLWNIMNTTNELGLELINKSICLFDINSDNLSAFKLAVEPKSMGDLLDPVIVALATLKKTLEKILPTLKMFG